MNKYKNNRVAEVLDHLHEDAKKDYMRVGKGIVKSIFRPLQPKDFAHAYLPISKNQGEALKQLIIQNDSKYVVEFGTSFGISTIYLADAVKQTGGKVISTELIKSKADIAIQNIEKAGLDPFVEIRVGDAMQTLQGDHQAIDFLFLDGWKDLYLPLFKMLEPYFHAGTLIYADNMDMAGTKIYGDYILAKKNQYSSKFVHGGKAMLTGLAA